MKKPKKKGEVPEFHTEEEEAEFWATHSPLDYEMKREKARAVARKDRPTTIRLNSESRKKLEQLAAGYHMGPSTFARRIIDAALRRLDQSQQKPLTVDEALEFIQTLMPRDLEERVRLFSEQNPAVLDDLIKNQDAAEALLKEIASFLLRVGGLLKASGFTLESAPGRGDSKAMGE